MGAGMMDAMFSASYGPAAKRVLRTRLLMAGAFVGALLALSLSWTFSWGTAGQASERGEVREAAFHATPGQCLNWSQQRARDAKVVPCAQPHLFEVTSVQNISREYPRKAPPPDLKKWHEIAEKRCGKNIEEYLGGPLDPHGKYSVTILRPTTAEWHSGERKVRCGLQRTGPGGGLLTTTGHAAKQPQSSVFEAGTCLGLLGKSVGGPVDCAKPHAYEIIATVDLTEEFKFTDGYPSAEDQNAWLDKKCNTALKTYTGGADISEQDLLLGWDTAGEDSWNAGSTKVNCKVGKPLEDGSGLAPITGSVAKKPDKSASSAPTSTSGGK